MSDAFRQAESGNSLGMVESRAHARTRVHALAYIEFSDQGNGGLILNITEDGLAVQAVQVLPSDFFPSMKFRLPKTEIPIEAAGKLVWQLRSKKEAGIQFVGLSEETRTRIRQWIATGGSGTADVLDVSAASPPGPAASAEVLPDRPELPHPPQIPPPQPAVATPPALPVPVPALGGAAAAPTLARTPAPESKPPSLADRGGQPQPSPQMPAATSAVAARTPASSQSIRQPPASPSSSSQSQPQSPNAGPWSKATLGNISPEFGDPRRWWLYTAALGFVAVMAVVLMAFFDHGSVGRSPQQNASSRPNAALHSAPATAPSQKTVANSGARAPLNAQRPRVPGSSRNQNVAQNLSSTVPNTSSTQTLPTPSDAQRPEAASAGSTESTAGGAAALASSNASVIPPKDADTQRDQDAYAPRTAQPAESTAQSVSAMIAEPLASSGKLANSAPSPVPPSVPLQGVRSGSVGASSQFHAIWIPPSLQSNASPLTGKLQIGPLLSSFSPEYPVEAAQQGAEGIVTLDLIVGPKGDVESVRVMSGPPLLTDASVSAVKQWRYGPTFLGRHLVGAEQYVTLVFRLSK